MPMKCPMNKLCCNLKIRFVQSSCMMSLFVVFVRDQVTNKVAIMCSSRHLDCSTKTRIFLFVSSRHEFTIIEFVRVRSS